MSTPKLLDKNVKINLRETECHAYRNRLIHFVIHNVKNFHSKL